MTQVFSDTIGPIILPFGSQTLILPKFDVAAYAALEGVSQSNISLVGVELQAEFQALEASIKLDSGGPACTTSWAFDLVAGVSANAAMGTPDLFGGMVLNLAGQANLPNANGGPPPWDYEWYLSVDGGGPYVGTDCYSTTTGLAGWIASTGATTVSFGTASSAVDQINSMGCSITTTSISNSCVLTLKVQYHYCVALVAASPGVFCFGDGVGTPCPCGNDNDGSLSCGFAGCANSSSSGGASLGMGGSLSTALDDMVLSARGLVPGQPGLYFQGLNAVNGGLGSPFGDGLRCVGGSVVRLAVQAADSGGFSDTQGLGLAQLGGVAAGDVRRYQLWYRDPAASPCGTGFNLSNGVEVSWMP